MHSVTIVTHLPEFDLWPVWMVPVMSELSGVNDQYVDGVMSCGGFPRDSPHSCMAGWGYPTLGLLC
jgi:hypothetical protein